MILFIHFLQYINKKHETLLYWVKYNCIILIILKGVPL